ncbi:peptidoglycan-binding protein [Amylibacter sp.]|nr:peptidoglycan-binding protein [Amylibacter sp.]
MKSVKILLISIITIFLSSLAHAELNINRVITSVEGSGKWITVRTSFYNVDSDNVTEIFRMGIDGDLENGNFHALRFDERSFRIPKEYSFESQPGRFFFADFSVNSGAFRNLYNYLDTKNQANIEAACNYMNNNKVIDKILKTKSINNAHGPFLANQKTKKSLSYLLDLCVKTSAKVYVVDVQNYLAALGYNVGKIDGKWGRKSELGLAKFQTDRGLEVKTAVSSNLLRMMKADVIDKEIKFSTLSTKPQYFDAKGKLIGKSKYVIRNLREKLQIYKSTKNIKDTPFQNSKYLKGIAKEQWNTIGKIGDPQNCYNRLNNLDTIERAVEITAKNFGKNKDIIIEVLQNHKIIYLSNGIFHLTKTINLTDKILIGSNKTVLDASLLETGVIVSNGTLKNVRIINAKKIGVSVIKNSNIHNVIIENTGVGVENNSKGHGVSILGENSTGNCLVSVEAFNGFNKTGDNCCRNGGNADGFNIKFGANGVTLIDTHGHHNSDDGFDLWKSGHNAPIKKEDIIIRIYYSSANLNGKNPLTPNGDGNGFKLGSSDKYQASKQDKGARLIYGSVACYNKLNGFDRNSTKMKIFAGRLQATGNGAEQFRDITRYIKTPADPYTLKCKMFPRY